MQLNQAVVINHDSRNVTFNFIFTTCSKCKTLFKCHFLPTLLFMSTEVVLLNNMKTVYQYLLLLKLWEILNFKERDKCPLSVDPCGCMII